MVKTQTGTVASGQELQRAQAEPKEPRESIPCVMPPSFLLLELHVAQVQAETRGQGGLDNNPHRSNCQEGESS